MKRWSIITDIVLLIFIDLCLLLLFWTPKVDLFGQKFDLRSRDIDVSALGRYDIDQYINTFGDFVNLKSVSFGEKKISHDEKELLVSQYPEIDFYVKSFINIYGKEYDDDVTAIDLSDVTIDNRLSTYLSEFTNLNYINLNNQSLTFSEILTLKETFPQINFELQIPFMGNSYNSSSVSLNFSNYSNIDHDVFEQFLSLFPNLNTLDMSYTNYSNEELGLLREKFPNVKINWVIHMGKWSLRTDAISFSVLITKYDYVRLTSEDIEVLKYCTDLQTLDLGHQRITDISHLVEYVPELRVLILADNKITDVSPLAKLKHLHYLELFVNPISDISSLKDCKELVDLNISFTDINNIDGILDLPKLERLFIRNLNLKESDYQKLYAAYPDSEVSRYGNTSISGTWRTHVRYFEMIKGFRNNYISEEFTKYD